MEPNGKAGVLYVSYPMLPVSDASCGGAEQMLWALEREMHLRGWRTVVAGCEGSRVQGELFSTGEAPRETDFFEQRSSDHSGKITELLRGSNGDFALVHDKSGHFWKSAGETHHAILATLHLPRSFYPTGVFEATPGNVFFNCVSKSQAESFRDLPRMLGVVNNGIALDRFELQCRKADYLLWMGRICPEKGAHLAIEVAHRAKMPLVLAGQVYPFSYHQEYSRREIEPQITADGSSVRFVESPSFDEKVKLLQNARALLVTSLAPETSSLVAMEAMACGTPVIALRRGALPEVVEHGVSGFVVDDLSRIVAAVDDVEFIWPEACRSRVEEKFSATRMASDYEELYERVTAGTSTLREAA